MSSYFTSKFEKHLAKMTKTRNQLKNNLETNSFFFQQKCPVIFFFLFLFVNFFFCAPCIY